MSAHPFRAIALSVVLAMAGGVVVHAAQDGGATAGNALLRGSIGARPAAFGGAYTAIADGPLALRYNPAGLSGEERNKIFLQYDASILDINRSDIAYSMPLWGGGLAVGFSTINYGSIVRTTTANKTGVGTFGANDYLLKIGYGRRVSDRLHLGANLGYYRFDLDDVSSNGIVADLGLAYEMSVEGLSFGASVRNIGSRAQFQSAREELPLALVLGGAYRPNQKILVSLDYELARSMGGAIKAGLEYSPIEVLALRLGYDGRNEAASGLTLGAGFKVNALNIDYAFVPFGDFGNEHRISAEWVFGQTTRRDETISLVEDRPRSSSPPDQVRRPKSAQRPPREDAPTAPEPLPYSPPASSVAAVDQRGAPVRIKTAPIQQQRTVSEILDDAKTAADNGDPAREEELYREAIKLDPNDATTLYNLATVRYLANDYREARGLYETITGLTPNDVDAWLYLGMCETKLGRSSPARTAFARVLELDPQNTYARQMMTPQGTRGR